MDALQRLIAIEEIKQLKARYFRCLDLKDWDGMARIFTPDATAEYPRRDGSGKASGATEICGFIRRSVEGITTAHHGHTPEITIVSATEATGIWPMEDYLWWAQPKIVDAPWPAGGDVSSYHGFGHYYESYAFTGTWQIKSLLLKRIRIEVQATRA